VLYRVPIGPTGALGDAQTITLAGDYVHVPGAFNLNGIDAERQDARRRPNGQRPSVRDQSGQRRREADLARRRKRSER
jgi:hypothetical protein